MFLAYFLYQFVQNVGRVHNAPINTGIFLFALSIVSITQWLGPDTSVFSLYLYNFSAFRTVTLSIWHLPFFCRLLLNQVLSSITVSYVVLADVAIVIINSLNLAFIYRSGLQTSPGNPKRQQTQVCAIHRMLYIWL